MSLHRRAAKRDANEPAIVSALEALGCVVWRVSGKGLPDLVVFHRGLRYTGHNEADRQRRNFFADVKGPKEKATPAQEEKWTALINLGFSVFILRTPEDAAAMLNNALQPWEPEGCVNQRPRSNESRKHLAQIVKSTKATLRTRKGDAAKVRDKGWALGMVAAAYTPPRSTPVDAAKEAEATFAPAAHECQANGCTTGEFCGASAVPEQEKGD